MADIQAVIFDLDGTLVQTEKLKALSYAQAAIELCPYDLNKEVVIEAFKEVVGRSRREVAEALVSQFNLAAKARARQAQFGVHTAWQAFVQVRLDYYEAMLANADVIRDNQWPYNRLLLEEVRQAGCLTGLATMSHCRQAQRVLTILGLDDAFDFIATRDDVEKGKPDPEIYLLVAQMLAIRPASCLVIEDSPSGVRAALEAGMEVLAVSTPFTSEQLNKANLVPAEHLANDPEQVVPLARKIMAA